MKRSRLRPISEKRRKSAAKAKEEFQDSRGVAFDDVRRILGEDRSKWPTAKLIVDPDVCSAMHTLFIDCWGCGRMPSNYGGPRIQAHHCFSGSRGRSDEMTLVAMLCEKCHGQLKETILPEGRILYLTWKRARFLVDWVRLTICKGVFLDDLIAD